MLKPLQNNLCHCVNVCGHKLHVDTDCHGSQLLYAVPLCPAHLVLDYRASVRYQTRCARLQVGRMPSRIERDRMKLKLLEEAHIVCSTLSFSGSPIFAQMARKFDVVVIDEAAQAVEPAILVPLVQGVKQVC